MRRATRLLLTLAGLAAVCSFWLGCGGAPNLECGKNTVRVGDACVPESSAARTCGDGTRVDPETGACILGQNGCGPRTFFDVDRETCVPTERACTDGSEFADDRCVAVTRCGQRTRLNSDGVCVPDVDTLCQQSPGVRYSAQRDRCVVGTASCGPGTTLSSESGVCVIAESNCGSGLFVNDDGECAPRDEICEPDGVLTSVDGSPLCVPEATCQPGDVVLSARSGPGVCTEPARALARNPELQESENNDPSTDNGEADRLSLGSNGRTIAVTGTIEPPRQLDADDQPESDIDSFAFTANAGRRIQLTAQSLGLPQPFIRIRGPNNYVRTSIFGESAGVRDLLLPYDGEYQIDVLATTQFGWNDVLGGDESWRYVLGITPSPRPSPTVHNFDANPAEASLPGLENNVYRLNSFSPGDLLEISTPTVGNGAQSGPIIQLWHSWGELASIVGPLEPGRSEIVTYPQAASPGTALLVVDWRGASNSSLDYSLDISPADDITFLGSLGSDQTIQASSIDLQPDDSAHFRLTVPAEHFLQIRHTNPNQQPIRYELTGTNASYSAVEFELPPDRQLNADDSATGYHYFPSRTTLRMTLQPAGFQTVKGVETEVTAVPVNRLPSGLQPGHDLVEIFDTTQSAGRSDWHRFSLNGQAQLELVTSALRPADGGANFQIEVLAPDRNGDFQRDGRLVSTFPTTFNDGDTASLTDDLSTFERDIPAGDYFIRVGHGRPNLDRYRIDAELAPIPTPESEPNDSPGNSSTLQINQRRQGQTQQNDPDYWEFDFGQTLADDEYLELYARAMGDSKPLTCTLLDAAGQSFSYSGHALNNQDGRCLIRLSSLPNGSYNWRITSPASDTVTYRLSARVQNGHIDAEPNEQPSDASPSPVISSVPQLGVISQSDTDYWALEFNTLLQQNEYLELRATSEVDPSAISCNFFDSAGSSPHQPAHSLDKRDGGCTLRFNTLPIDSYLLEVESDATEQIPYELSASVRTGDIDVEPNDSFGTATPVDFPFDPPIRGVIRPSDGGDTDYFSFTVSANGSPDDGEFQRIEVNPEDPQPLDCALTDSTGDPVTLGSRSLVEQTTPCRLDVPNLAPGDYTLEITWPDSNGAPITGAPTPYSVTSQLEEGYLEVEPNDSPATATTVPVGQTALADAYAPQQGGVQTYSDYFVTSLNTSIGPQEILVVKAPAATNSGAYNCNLLDNGGATLSEYNLVPGFNGDQGCYIYLNNAPAGFYTLEFLYTENNASDHYTVTFERRDGILETEPNDNGPTASTGSNATSISYTDFSDGVRLYGDALSNGQSDDIDFFQITAPANNSTSNFSADCRAFAADNETLNWSLLNSAGTQLDSAPNQIHTTLSTSGLSPQDFPLYLRIDGGIKTADNHYRCKPSS